MDAFKAEDRVWVLDRGEWYRGVVEGVIDGTRFDRALRYVVRWGDGGGFGIQGGVRRAHQLRLIDDGDRIGAQLTPQPPT